MKNNTSRKNTVSFFVLTVILLCALLLGLLCGSTVLTPREIFVGLFTEQDTTLAVILRHIRLPRVLAGLLAGIGLSVSGSLLQSITDNGLAGPNIIGVNAGAGFFTILLLCFFPAATAALPLAAFCGALLAAMLIIGFAGRLGSSKGSVILAGIALTAILNAGISTVSLIDTDVIAVYADFSIGGLAGVTMQQLPIPALFILLSLTVALLLSPKIAVLCLGDQLAATLGIRVKRLRFICLLCAAASAAAVVSFAGLLGFVGLIVPHIARRITGGSFTLSLPASALIGGALVILADTVGRTVLSPTEVPVGIVMALIGAPFFLVLLLRRRYDA